MIICQQQPLLVLEAGGLVKGRLRELGKDEVPFGTLGSTWWCLMVPSPAEAEESCLTCCLCSLHSDLWAWNLQSQQQSDLPGLYTSSSQDVWSKILLINWQQKLGTRRTAVENSIYDVLFSFSCQFKNPTFLYEQLQNFIHPPLDFLYLGTT